MNIVIWVLHGKEQGFMLAWIYYQSAFDRVPHSWVKKSIDMVEADNNIVNYQWRNGIQGFM
jgi:hypothetical protein